jgi:hypothetical protein
MWLVLNKIKLEIVDYSSFSTFNILIVKSWNFNITYYYLEFSIRIVDY